MAVGGGFVHTNPLALPHHPPDARHGRRRCAKKFALNCQNRRNLRRESGRADDHGHVMLGCLRSRRVTRQIMHLALTRVMTSEAVCTDPTLKEVQQAVVHPHCPLQTVFAGKNAQQRSPTGSTSSEGAGHGNPGCAFND